MTTTDEEIAYNVPDLRSDSALWCQAAGLLEQALGQARGENLPNSAFMLNGMLVAEAYRDLGTQLMGRLVDGVAQFNGLCRALSEIADDYERYEGDVVSVVAGIDGEIEVEGS